MNTHTLLQRLPRLLYFHSHMFTNYSKPKSKHCLLWKAHLISKSERESFPLCIHSTHSWALLILDCYYNRVACNSFADGHYVLFFHSQHEANHWVDENTIEDWRNEPMGTVVRHHQERRFYEQWPCIFLGFSKIC